jgi:serine/threonine protein kinase
MKLFGVYETGNSLYIVTEYIEGVTLENFLKANKGKINYEQRRNIVRMILKALN